MKNCTSWKVLPQITVRHARASPANPLDGSAVQDWDEATCQLMAVINYDEANIIAHLLARRDADLARHESDMTRAIAAWQTASVKLSEQASQQPEFHLRRVGGDEELYAPCGKIIHGEERTTLSR